MTPKYSANELLAILSARQLKDGMVVFAGVGIPLLAATLAQRLHCPGLTILFEGGVIGAFIEPGKLPLRPMINVALCAPIWCLAAPRSCYCCNAATSTLASWAAPRSNQYGNLNSSFIGDPKRPKSRLPGSGGGNDIASLTNMIVAMKHEKRRFVENVDFITSPGWISVVTRRGASPGCRLAVCGV